jgi:hypothetical protein
MDDNDQRIREFIEFRAETRLELGHIRDTLARLRPIEEARSGERMEIQTLAREVNELRQDGAATRAEIKQANASADARMDRLEDRQKRTLAIMLGVSMALQAVGALLVWALNAGLLKMGVP